MDELKINEYIKRGSNIIFEERLEDWKRCVIVRSNDLYSGVDLNCALNIMEALESETPMDEVVNIFDNQNHSAVSATIARSILFSFSSKGPEFYEATACEEISDENRKIIDAKKEENLKLAQVKTLKK